MKNQERRKPKIRKRVGKKKYIFMAAKTETSRPLLAKEWNREIGPRKARKLKKSALIQIEKILLPASYRKGATLKLDRKKGIIQVLVKTKEVGKHFFPPDIKSLALSPALMKRYEAVNYTGGSIPNHLALNQFPKKLDKKLQVRKRFQVSALKRWGKDISLPTNIFGSDERFTFNDTSFPWCACGKVETEAGWGSGVMIGPRHMMTASHVVVWKPNNTCGWIKFTPLKFDNSEPFGHAWATRVYFWNKADGSDGLNLTEGAFDYVVVVLDSRVGDNLTGWMGSRGYDTGWNGGNFWGHVGYPQDLSGGTRPTFIGYQSFRDEDSASVSGRSSFRIEHRIDVIPGQSGGPYFGWWSGEPWPRVVGIQSGQQLGGPSGDNTCGGGNPLSELISYARNAEP